VTLAVHPWFGCVVSIVRAHGTDVVRVERDGCQGLRNLPLEWTGLQPRPKPLSIAAEPVRLCPRRARLLSLWVSTRVTRAQSEAGDMGRIYGSME